MTPITDEILKQAKDSVTKPLEINVSRERFGKLRTEILEYGVKWQTFRFPLPGRIELLVNGETQAVVTLEY